MATKTEIRKWTKEILAPIFKKHGFKQGKDKECFYTGGGRLYFLKKSPQEARSIYTHLLNRRYFQIESIQYTNFVLNKKLLEISGVESVLCARQFLAIGTSPYYELINLPSSNVQFENDIHTRDQLETYLQPFVDNFDWTIQVVEYYKYVPHYLSYWDKLNKLAKASGNYRALGFVFGGAFIREMIYFFKRMTGDPSASELYEYALKLYDDCGYQCVKREKVLRKIKEYFDNISPEELAALYEEFAPWFVKPDFPFPQKPEHLRLLNKEDLEALSQQVYLSEIIIGQTAKVIAPL